MRMDLEQHGRASHPRATHRADAASELAEEIKMRYLLAWLLGVPGAVIIVWFLLSHH